MAAYVENKLIEMTTTRASRREKEIAHRLMSRVVPMMRCFAK